MCNAAELMVESVCRCHCCCWCYCWSYAFPWMKRNEEKSQIEHFSHSTKAYAQRVMLFSFALFFGYFVFFGSFQALVDILPIFRSELHDVRCLVWVWVFVAVQFALNAHCSHNKPFRGDKYASHTFVCIVQFDDIPPQMPTCTICNSSNSRGKADRLTPDCTGERAEQAEVRGQKRRTTGEQSTMIQTNFYNLIFVFAHTHIHIYCSSVGGWPAGDGLCSRLHVR